jgi:uncharacterized protein DUF5715
LRRGLLLFLILSLVPAAGAVRLAHPPRHKHKPKPEPYRAFPPTHESLVLQNAEADRLGLERFADNTALAAAVARGDLVPLPTSDHLYVDRRLDPKRRYCRPWVAAFLTDLSESFYQEFGQPLLIDSAVRTVRVQRSLLRWNHNAAPWHGELASVHIAGIAVDIARRPLTGNQIRWLQFKLEYYHALGLVIVEEELKQPCFHIVVSGDYPNGHFEPERVEPVVPDQIDDTDQPN